MPRGSRPGERRGGRTAGTPNKATAEVKATAQKYTAESIQVLATIMKTGESEQARIAAARELLDRAHGKPAQSVAVGGDPNNTTPIRQIINEYVLKEPHAAAGA